MLLGIDTGGTFTDFVLFENGKLRIHKVLSTPEAPEQSILQGVSELGISLNGLRVIHGTTVATNAVLEGKGARTVFITNRGFKDLLTIGRQARQELYNLQPPLIEPPVPEELCLETGGRLSAEGELLEPLTNKDLHDLAEDVSRLQAESVAINLLFSFLDETPEKAIADAMPEGVFVSRSSEVLPVLREYERGITTWMNAYVGPLVQGYLQRLQEQLSPAKLSIMQSAGETCSATQAGIHAVRLLLSGPAGGLKGAQFVAAVAGFDRLMTLDMGGTSTDVALIDEHISLTDKSRLGRYPVAVPMVDMHTIGAGGGSIARVDEGGLLQVGPESAGANPGPACYGGAGQQATVTDANLLLGRLPVAARLGGSMSLDRQASERVLKDLADKLGLESAMAAAMGVIQLANEHMAAALRVISVNRGFDPRDFVLCCFGGAGGLHVCELAELLGINQALVPAYGGVLSALGMLAARPGRQLTRTISQPLESMTSEEIEQLFDDLIEQGIAEMMEENIPADKIQINRSLDLCFQGQAHALNVSWKDREQAAVDFIDAHKHRYGHVLEVPVELTNVRVGLSGPSLPISLEPQHCAKAAESFALSDVHGITSKVSVLQRENIGGGVEFTGPKIIIDVVSTTWIAPGWHCRYDEFGNLILTKEEK